MKCCPSRIAVASQQGTHRVESQEPRMGPRGNPLRCSGPDKIELGPTANGCEVSTARNTYREPVRVPRHPSNPVAFPNPIRLQRVRADRPHVGLLGLAHAGMAAGHTHPDVRERREGDP
eukprot:EG_transcript_36391